MERKIDQRCAANKEEGRRGGWFQSAVKGGARNLWKREAEMEWAWGKRIVDVDCWLWLKGVYAHS
jgi:hypothetical protein